jgi:nucleotide-binding universal stress UspA family protein
MEGAVRHPCPRQKILMNSKERKNARTPSPSAPVRLKRIVVPTDFSAASRKAIDQATAFAKLCDGEVTLVHVIEPAPYPEFGYAHIPMKEAKLKRAAREQLAALCRKLADAGLTCGFAIRTGSAFHEITEQAREESADLIVVATHGRGALAHLLLGSTAERVVRHAPCPVLVVRERDRDSGSA